MLLLLLQLAWRDTNFFFVRVTQFLSWLPCALNASLFFVHKKKFWVAFSCLNFFYFPISADDSHLRLSLAALRENEWKKKLVTPRMRTACVKLPQISLLLLAAATRTKKRFSLKGRRSDVIFLEAQKKIPANCVTSQQGTQSSVGPLVTGLLILLEMSMSKRIDFHGAFSLSRIAIPSPLTHKPRTKIIRKRGPLRTGERPLINVS